MYWSNTTTTMVMELQSRFPPSDGMEALLIAYPKFGLNQGTRTYQHVTLRILLALRQCVKLT